MFYVSNHINFPKKVDRLEIKIPVSLLTSNRGHRDCNQFHLGNVCNCRVDRNDRSRPYFIKNKPKNKTEKEKKKSNNSEWTVKNKFDITDLRVTRKKVQPLPHWNEHEMVQKKQQPLVW